MNTGIGDAIDLAWKISSVVRRGSDDSLLDTYEPERIAFARRLVATTDRVFTAVTSFGFAARRVRLDFVPLIFPLLFRFPPMRRFLFRTISQISVNYRDSALSEGSAGPVRGGDRLPWAAGAGESDGGGSDNYAPLVSMDWQLHVYGEARDELRAFCETRKLALHVFPWQRMLGENGLRRRALYLVRPDGYLGLVDSEARPAVLDSYCDKHRIVFDQPDSDRAALPRSRAAGESP